MIFWLISEGPKPGKICHEVFYSISCLNLTVEGEKSSTMNDHYIFDPHLLRTERSLLNPIELIGDKGYYGAGPNRTCPRSNQCLRLLHLSSSRLRPQHQITQWNCAGVDTSLKRNPIRHACPTTAFRSTMRFIEFCTLLQFGLSFIFVNVSSIDMCWKNHSTLR